MEMTHLLFMKYAEQTWGFWRTSILFHFLDTTIKPVEW